jgi:carboxylesterase type B
LAAFRAFHGSERFFVLGKLTTAGSFTGTGSFTPTPAEVGLSDEIMGYWARFAATGDPNGGDASPWPRYDPATDAMPQLDDVSSVIYEYHNSKSDYLATLPQPQN